MTQISFSVVIPNFNGASDLKQCLSSVFIACRNSGYPCQIILVDNHSSDDSLNVFKKISQKHHPAIKTKTINLPKNTGFAYAVNQGICEAEYEYIAVLNNDLKLSPDWLTTLSESILNSSPQTAVFMGTVLNKTGQHIESRGFKYEPFGRCHNIGNGQVFHKSSSVNHRPSIIWGAPAAAVIYRKTVLQKLGAFDPHFFAYLEDVDLAYRLHQAGYQTLYVPATLSYHTGGSTSGKMGNLRQYYTTRNWHLLILKNYPLKLILKLFPLIAAERLRNLCWYLKSTPIYLLPFQTIKMTAEIIYLGIHLRYTNGK